ncbi:MAG: DUF1778 domain-containing protein [Actinomycetota bacterium]
MTLTNKTDRIDLRVSAAQKALIASAAKASQKGVSEFIIESVIRQAEETILDQRLFILSDADFQKLEAELEGPAAQNPEFEKYLDAKAPWEK